MGRKKRTQEPVAATFTVLDEPIDRELAEQAVTHFILTFVAKTKRDRALLAFGRNGNREGLLQQIPEWVETKYTTELVGNSGFDYKLEKTFGPLIGVLITAKDERRVTIGSSVMTASGGAGLFIAEQAGIALLLREFGPPILCRTA